LARRERRYAWHLFRLYDFAREPAAFEPRPPLDAHVALTAMSFQSPSLVRARRLQPLHVMLKTVQLEGSRARMSAAPECFTLASICFSRTALFPQNMSLSSQQNVEIFLACDQNVRYLANAGITLRCRMTAPSPKAAYIAYG
jgi:hypothetical protein